jgi:alkylresorcinol/alkylpyrone synthase
VPEIAGRDVRPALVPFLRKHGLALSDIGVWFTHPGGPKVIDALEKCLELSGDALSVTRRSLYDVGNLSSASVLHVMENTLRNTKQKTGTWGVMVAMGPGFCAEFVLLKW